MYDKLQWKMHENGGWFIAAITWTRFIRLVGRLLLGNQRRRRALLLLHYVYVWIKCITVIPIIGNHLTWVVGTSKLLPVNAKLYARNFRSRCFVRPQTLSNDGDVFPPLIIHLWAKICHHANLARSKLAWNPIYIANNVNFIIVMHFRMVERLS